MGPPPSTPVSSATSGDLASSPIGPRRRRKSISTAIAVVIVLVVVLAGVYYVETRPAGPTDVTLESIWLSVNYTNHPAGQAPPASFEVYFAWFVNSTTESPSVTNLQAPAGGVALLHLSIDYDARAGTQNCTVYALDALSPFGIASMYGDFKSGWTSQPLPLNFSGATLIHDPVASLDLNVTLPDKDGVYTPVFDMNVTCEQY